MNDSIADNNIRALPLYRLGFDAGKDVGLRLALDALTAERVRQETMAADRVKPAYPVPWRRCCPAAGHRTGDTMNRATLTRLAAATGLTAAAMTALAPPTDAAAARGCTLITAHRGQDGRHTENTIPSYKGAVAEGAEALETDIRLTKDDRIVMMHDPKVDRTTNGTGRVDEMTLAQIRNLKTNDGGYVPTLAQVTANQLGGVTLILEIKPNNAGWDDASARALAGLLHRTHYASRTVVYSLVKPDLALMRKNAPEIETGLTVLRGPVTADYVLSHADDVFPPVAMSTRKWVKGMHAAGVRVFTRTAHIGPKGWAKLIVGRTRKQRPDSMTTDHVKWMVKWCAGG